MLCLVGQAEDTGADASLGLTEPQSDGSKEATLQCEANIVQGDEGMHWTACLGLLWPFNMSANGHFFICRLV